MFLVVDDDGVRMRYLTREHWLPWREIHGVELITGVRGSDTIRFNCREGGYFDVPPSLLQPSKPTGRLVARRMLLGTLAQIEGRRSVRG
jgi:PH (Pleckstrin Homology) domain-containing protein